MVVIGSYMEEKSTEKGKLIGDSHGLQRSEWK